MRVATRSASRSNRLARLQDITRAPSSYPDSNALALQQREASVCGASAGPGLTGHAIFSIKKTNVLKLLKYTGSKMDLQMSWLFGAFPPTPPPPTEESGEKQKPVRN